MEFVEGEREEKNKINNNNNNSRGKSGVLQDALRFLSPLNQENVEEKVYEVKEQRKQTTCFLSDNSRAGVIQTPTTQQMSTLHV